MDEDFKTKLYSTDFFINAGFYGHLFSNLNIWAVKVLYFSIRYYIMGSKDILMQMADKINIAGKDEILKDSKKIQVTLSDSEPYYVVIGNSKIALFDGTTENATSVIKSTDQVLSDIMTGKTNAFSAFMGGKVTVSGDLFYVQKLINSLTKAK